MKHVLVPMACILLISGCRPGDTSSENEVNIDHFKEHDRHYYIEHVGFVLLANYQYDSLLNQDFSKLNFDDKCFYGLMFLESERDLSTARRTSILQSLKPFMDSIVSTQQSIDNICDNGMAYGFLLHKLLDRCPEQALRSSYEVCLLPYGTNLAYAQVNYQWNSRRNTQPQDWSYFIDTLFEHYFPNDSVPIIVQLRADYLETTGDSVAANDLRKLQVHKGYYVYDNCQRLISSYSQSQNWNEIEGLIPICERYEFEHRIPGLVPYYLQQRDTNKAIELLYRGIKDTISNEVNLVARVQLSEIAVWQSNYVLMDSLYSTFPIDYPVFKYCNWDFSGDLLGRMEFVKYASYVGKKDARGESEFYENRIFPFWGTQFYFGKNQTDVHLTAVLFLRGEMGASVTTSIELPW